MESPFENINASESNTNSFWQPYTKNFQLQTIFFTSTLYFLTKSSTLKPRTMSLTKTHILKHSKSSERIKSCSKISWKKLDFFTETIGTEVRYGFRLGYPSSFQDFYTESSQDLDLWIKKLTNLVILTEFDQDFVSIKEIGSGNYGSVMLVEEFTTHKPFAMKSIPRSWFANNPSGTSSLKNEIQILRDLSHPSINKLERVYEEEDRVCLVLEYQPAGDLFGRVLKQDNYSEEAASALAYNLLSVLKYIHRHDYIHRDLKLENILMQSKDSDTEIVLCDFGLACNFYERNIPRCGSPGYVAPEILHNKHYTSKVDIFAVGVIVYVLLSGTAPFSGDSQEKVLLMNKQCKVKFEAKDWEERSDSAKDFIKEMMEPDPVFRVSAAEALNHPWIRRNAKMGSTPKTQDEKFDGNGFCKNLIGTNVDQAEIEDVMNETYLVDGKVDVNL